MLPYYYPGQTTEHTIIDSYETWWRRREQVFQKAPFNLPAAYYRLEGKGDPGGSIFTVIGSPRYNASQIAGICAQQQGLEAQAANISYERFRDQTATNAALGVDFVEYRQSLNSITKRAGQLLDFTRKVKKFDFVGAARVLAEASPTKVIHEHTRFGFSRIATVPKGVSPHKTLANNWLEYHFGWEPLVKDVFDSMEILHNPVKKFASLKGTGTTTRTDLYSDNQGSVTDRGGTVFKVRHRQGGFVKAIQSDTLHSLEQYGLLNPLVLAWEVIPFSFVVDWFASVGDVLRSYSDFAGMTLTNTWSTIVVKAENSGMVRINPGYPPAAPRRYQASGLYCRRSLSLTQPVFSVKPLRLPSKVRAATAISLLIQQLRR